MNTQHFKYAVEIEKTRSITQAAENLYMAQPNLSKAIKELEDSLGITIFRRTSKGVIPTEQGEQFLDCAKRILIQIDNMEALNAPEHTRWQKMKISIPRASYLSAAFSSFMGEFSLERGIEVYLRETNSITTIENVRENNYNLGVIRFKTIFEKYYDDYLKKNNMDYELLWEYDYVALMSKDHPLANVPTVTYDELAKTGIEVRHGDRAVPYLSARELKDMEGQDDENALSKRVYVYERASQYALLSRQPNTFMMVSPEPEQMLSRFGLVQRRCDRPDGRYRDLLIYPRGHKLSPMERRFINKLYEAKNEVAFEEYV